MTGRQPRVVIVQERLPHYRVAFFQALLERLAACEIDLAVVHGRSQGAAAHRRDEGSLPWAQVVSNRVVRVGSASLVQQPVIGITRSADLVIVEQASRMAANYPLLVRQARGGPKVAFWGHGANLQSDGSWHNRASEAAKACISRLPHWWFAYTDGCARRVEALGFSAERITVVENAVDAASIAVAKARPEPHRAIFVGSLTSTKRLDLIVQACDLLAAQMPSFSLAIVGDGELRSWVRHHAAARSYITYLGAKVGSDLGVELKRSSVMLMPSGVGLGVLDAFAAGIPVVTATGEGHGPEFEYLSHGGNSLITDPNPQSLASAVLQALDPARNAALRGGASRAATRWTVENMVENFTEGILRACHAVHTGVAL